MGQHSYNKNKLFETNKIIIKEYFLDEILFYLLFPFPFAAALVLTTLR